MAITVDKSGLTIKITFAGYQDAKMMIGSLLNILSTQDKDSLCIDDINRVCCLIQELLPSDDQMLLLDRIDTGWCKVKEVAKESE